MTRAALAVFIKARLDELERYALAASSDWDRPATVAEHWRWECSNDDTPLDPELALASNEEVLAHEEHWGIGLRSLEKYPSQVSGMGPMIHLALTGPEEVAPGVARFIATMDPARAVAIVEAGRHLLGWADSPALPDVERYYALDAFAWIWHDHPEHPSHEEATR